MTSRTDPLLVFDLDGTVIAENSFPLWARFMLGGLCEGVPLHRRLGACGAVALALIERKLARRPHRLLKARLQAVWGWATAADTEGRAVGAFAQSLLVHRRACLSPLIDKVATEEVDALLATAAAEEYAAPLARLLGFSRVLSTPLRQAATADNLGAAKRDRVLAFRRASGWDGRPLVVVTDHIDDLPLMQVASRVVWCGARGELDSLRGRLPNLPIRHAEGCPAPELTRFVLAA